MKSIRCNILFTAVFFLLSMLSAAELEIGNFSCGRGMMGFGVLAEYPDGKAGEVVLTRKTRKNANTLTPNYFIKWGRLCSFRIYDPDGNLVKYVELGNQSEAEKEYRVKVPAGKPGIWRFSVSGGLASDFFHFRFPENGIWGVRGEKILRVTNAFPKKVWMFLPETSDTLVLIGSGIHGRIDGREVTGIKSKCNAGERLAVSKPEGKTLLEIELPAIHPKRNLPLCFDGLPGLMCPTPEAALKLKGGLVNVDGRYVEGPLQARALRFIRNFRQEDFKIPEAFLNKKFWLGPMSNQILDRDSINYGRARSFRKKLNFLNYTDSYYIPGIYAAFTAIQEPLTRDSYKQPGMVNRTILAAFAEILNMDASGIIRTGDLRTAGRLDTSTTFETFYGICRSYFLIKPFLTPEADAIYRSGVCEIADKMAGGMSYQSNQWMHIINGFCCMYLSTEEPRFKRMFEQQLNVFLDNAIQGKHGQHPDGYYIEDGGPDGNYDNMSGYPLAVMYYTYGRHPEADPALVAKMRRGIEKNMRFKSFFLFERPGSGKGYFLPYAHNHRIWGCLIGDGYPSIFLTSKEFDGAYTLCNLKNDPPRLPRDRGGEAGLLWRPLKQTSKRIRLPYEHESGVWELTGHLAWKHPSGLYGMAFWSVYDKWPDGIIGPLFLWHKKSGLAIASIKNRNKKYLTAAKPDEVTWSSITGTLDGKFFHSELRTQKKLEWIVKDKVFRITGNVMKDRKQSLGTVSWKYDLRGKDGIAMTVSVDVPSLKNPVLSIPFFADNGKNKGGLTSPGVFRFTSPTGTLDLEFPKTQQASVIGKMTADTFALRIPFPADGILKLRIAGR